MIVVKNLELIEVEEDYFYMYTDKPKRFIPIGDDIFLEKEAENKPSKVEGQEFSYKEVLDKFIDPCLGPKLYRDRKFTIGWTEAAEKAIGFPLDTIKDLREENKELDRKYKNTAKLNSELSAELNCFKNMPFWDRLKFLFTGGHNESH